MGSPTAIDQNWAEFVASRSPALRDTLIRTYAPLVRFVVGRLGIPPSSLLDVEDMMDEMEDVEEYKLMPALEGLSFNFPIMAQPEELQRIFPSRFEKWLSLLRYK